MTSQELMSECILLSLKLAASNTLALSKAGLLSADLAEPLADELKRVAEAIDASAAQDALPPKLADHIHQLAFLIRPQG